MNKKKRTIIFVICLFLLVTVGIVYIFSELYAEHDIPITTVTDAYKFKNEYESVNNNDLGNGKKVRELTIADNNPFVYKTAEELVNMIEEDKTFVVYFGFSTCPWCRSVMTSLIDSSLEKGVKKVYYVDIKEIRDTYELNDNNEPVRTKEGTDAYYRLLELLNPVLTDYNPLKYETKRGKTKEVKIDEKRIYAPNVVVVKNGEAISMESGIVKELTDPYMEIDEGIKCKIKEQFNCMFDKLNTDTNTCSIDEKTC